MDCKSASNLRAPLPWNPIFSSSTNGISHAKEEADRIAAQSMRDLETNLSRRQQLAQERIAQEEAKAIAEIRTIAVDVAIAASRQVIAASLDERRGAALIDDAIAALPRQLH